MLRFVSAASSCLVVQGGGGAAAEGVCALDLTLFSASRMGVALHLQYLKYHSLGNGESLLFAALQPAFYSQICIISLKLLWQDFPELL